VFGPWVGLRALVSFDDPGAATEPAAPAPPCPHCAADCAPAWAALNPASSEAEFRRDWRAWADARAACPLGAAHRYSEDQLAYHYTHDRDILRRIARDGAAA
jgi:methylmalonic aciduria homocystinuria type C protein